MLAAWKRPCDPRGFQVDLSTYLDYSQPLVQANQIEHGPRDLFALSELCCSTAKSLSRFQPLAFHDFCPATHESAVLTILRTLEGKGDKNCKRNSDLPLPLNNSCCLRRHARHFALLAAEFLKNQPLLPKNKDAETLEHDAAYSKSAHKNIQTCRSRICLSLSRITLFNSTILSS